MGSQLARDQRKLGLWAAGRIFPGLQPDLKLSQGFLIRRFYTVASLFLSGVRAVQLLFNPTDY